MRASSDSSLQDSHQRVYGFDGALSFFVANGKQRVMSRRSPAPIPVARLPTCPQGALDETRYSDRERSS